jgi:hypothetical protein
MDVDTFVVTDVADTVGNFLSKALLRKGHKVRVIGRSSEILQPLIDAGAEAMFGKLDDNEFLTEAFDGATAVFVADGRNVFSETARMSDGSILDSVKDALRNSEVQRVVVAVKNLSGSEVSRRIGKIPVLNAFEEFAASAVLMGTPSGKQFAQIETENVVAEVGALLMAGDMQKTGPVLSKYVGEARSLAIGASAGGRNTFDLTNRNFGNWGSGHSPVHSFVSNPRVEPVDRLNPLSNSGEGQVIAPEVLNRPRVDGCHLRCH